jgi:poly(hydroxyalkanoate) granule-associated protein
MDLIAPRAGSVNGGTNLNQNGNPMATKTANNSIFRLGELPRDVAGRVVKLPRAIAKDVSTRGRDVWLAGLGALATVEQEGTSLLGSLVKQGEKLVERGERVEKRGRERVETLKSDLDARRGEVVEKVETSVYEPMVEAIKRLGVPTLDEVRDLSAKVDALTQRVETLIGLVDAEGVQVQVRALFTVEAREEGWAVVNAGAEGAETRHPNKDEAVDHARGLAAAARPSQLVILRKDGTVQDTVTYDA